MFISNLVMTKRESEITSCLSNIILSFVSTVKKYCITRNILAQQLVGAYQPTNVSGINMELGSFPEH